MFSSFEFAKKRIIVRLIILFFLIMAIGAFIIIGFLTKTDSVNELKKTDASGGNDYMYDRIVAITFDDGPCSRTTNRLLDGLKERNVKATFFFCGDWISKYPADIKTIYEEGHDIASHGDRHKYMTKLTDKQQQEEIRGVTEKIQGLLGIKIDLFRAPYGDYNESVVKNARRMNYYIIQWNVDSLDWQEPTKEQLIKKVCEHKNLSPGSIILMHTGTKCTKQALKQIIRNIKAKGYQFVPASRLIYRSNYRIDPTGKQIKL